MYVMGGRGLMEGSVEYLVRIGLCEGILMERTLDTCSHEAQAGEFLGVCGLGSGPLGGGEGGRWLLVWRGKIAPGGVLGRSEINGRSIVTTESTVAGPSSLPAFTGYSFA